MKCVGSLVRRNKYMPRKYYTLLYGLLGFLNTQVGGVLIKSGPLEYSPSGAWGTVVMIDISIDSMERLLPNISF